VRSAPVGRTVLEGIDRARHQHPDEPWRQYVLLLRERLPLDENRDENALIIEHPGSYRFAEQLDADLAVLHESLVAIGADRLSRNAVWPVRRALDVFGFHLAALDIRQNSAFHDRALGQILAAAGFEDSDFANWSEEKRVAFLSKELSGPRPFHFSESKIGPEADAVLDCYRVLRKHLNAYGPEGIGSLIISMTRSLSDLLAVYVLAREAGLTRGLRGARTYGECRQRREFAARARRQGTRRVRAGQQHGGEWPIEYAVDRFQAHQRRDQGRVPARRQRLRGARRIGFGARQEDVHVTRGRNRAARAP